MASPNSMRPPSLIFLSAVFLLVLSVFPFPSLSHTPPALDTTNPAASVTPGAGSDDAAAGNDAVKDTGVGTGTAPSNPNTGTPLPKPFSPGQGRQRLRSAVDALRGAAAMGGEMPMPKDLMSSTESASRYQKHLIRQFVDGHNQVRAFFGMAPLTWNRTLARFAKRLGNANRESCEMNHSEDPRPYGENMFWGEGRTWRALDAVQDWAIEYQDYIPAINRCKPDKKCGHYTQMIWKSTSDLGCARVECTDGNVLVVCNYWPPGNYPDENPFNNKP